MAGTPRTIQMRWTVRTIVTVRTGHGDDTRESDVKQLSRIRKGVSCRLS